MRSLHLFKRLLALSALVLATAGAARADVIVPQPKVRPTPSQRPVQPEPATTRDAVALARRDPTIAAMLTKARSWDTPPDQDPSKTNPSSVDETAVQLNLGGSCGFAGCSSSTLVAFTFKSRGANTQTQTILALVTCGPIQSRPCQVAPAEVRPVGAQPAQR